MNAALPPALHLDLEDVLGNLQHARRAGDLARLLHLTYWDVRAWARWAHREALAARAADLVREQPQPSRAAFLEIVDDVIRELDRIHSESADAAGVQGHWAVPDPTQQTVRSSDSCGGS